MSQCQILLYILLDQLQGMFSFYVLKYTHNTHTHIYVKIRFKRHSQLSVLAFKRKPSESLVHIFLNCVGIILRFKPTTEIKTSPDF